MLLRSTVVTGWISIGPSDGIFIQFLPIVISKGFFKYQRLTQWIMQVHSTTAQGFQYTSARPLWRQNKGKLSVIIPTYWWSNLRASYLLCWLQELEQSRIHWSEKWDSLCSFVTLMHCFCSSNIASSNWLLFCFCFLWQGNYQFIVQWWPGQFYTIWDHSFHCSI